MAVNERLRAAMALAGLTAAELADAAGVDGKTCERWVSQGRVPHRSNARRAAAALREDIAYLWPGVEQGRRNAGLDPDLVGIYATRADVAMSMWRSVFEQASGEIGILVYAAVFLHELWPDFNDLLAAKAGAGCRVRILLGDPASRAVIERGQAERYGHGIVARCEQALLYYGPVIGTPGIEVHQHGTPLYNSVYRGDDRMLVNTHRYGMNAHSTPLLHLRRSGRGGLFDGYADSFEDVWRASRPASVRAGA
jgi:hypothetical protein